MNIGGTSRALPSYGFGPRAAAQAEIDAAMNYGAEAKRRLDARDSPLPAAVDKGDFAFSEKNLKGGTGEKIAGWLSAGLRGASGIMQARIDPYESLRKDYPELNETQLRVVAEALKRKGVRF